MMMIPPLDQFAQDTTAADMALQLQIFMEMPEEQRVGIGLAMCEEAYMICQRVLVEQLGPLTQGELVAATFERYYGLDMVPDEVERIKQALIEYHDK